MASMARCSSSSFLFDILTFRGPKISLAGVILVISIELQNPQFHSSNKTTSPVQFPAISAEAFVVFGCSPSFYPAAGGTDLSRCGVTARVLDPLDGWHLVMLNTTKVRRGSGTQCAFDMANSKRTQLMSFTSSKRTSLCFFFSSPVGFVGFPRQLPLMYPGGPQFARAGVPPMAASMPPMSPAAMGSLPPTQHLAPQMQPRP